MKKYVLSAMLILALMPSCKKQDDKTGNYPQPIQPSTYYPMTPGTYWIYDVFKVDPDSSVTDLHLQDSVFVSRRRSINGKTYFEIDSREKHFLKRSFRDSLGYLIDADGEIHFAPNDFSYPLETELVISGDDTILIGKMGMKEVSKPVVIPAGTFETLMLQRNYLVYSAKTPRQFQEHRAQNVGLVLYQYGVLANPALFELRLVRFHIE